MTAQMEPRRLSIIPTYKLYHDALMEAGINLPTEERKSCNTKRGWDKSPTPLQLFLVVEQDAVVEWIPALFHRFTAYSTVRSGTTKSNSNELPISIPTFLLWSIFKWPLKSSFLIWSQFSSLWWQKTMSCLRSIVVISRFGIRSGGAMAAELCPLDLVHATFQYDGKLRRSVIDG